MTSNRLPTSDPIIEAAVKRLAAYSLREVARAITVDPRSGEDLRTAAGDLCIRATRLEIEADAIQPRIKL